MWGKFFQLPSKFKDRTAATRQLRIMCPVSLEGAMTYKRQPNCKTRKWPRGPVLHGVGCCEAQQSACGLLVLLTGRVTSAPHDQMSHVPSLTLVLNALL